MKKNYPYLDVLKIIMCIFVVMIHINPIGDSIYPWVRVSIPMFFLLSSFIFYRKNLLLNNKKQNLQLIKYVRRNIILYCVWFLLTSPITFREKEYFIDGVKIGIMRLLRDFIFGSTFKSSWFLMALIIGMIIIFFMSKKISDKIILPICLFTYYCCCMASCYANLASKELIFVFKDMLRTSLDSSFVASLLWIEIGRIMAKYENKIAKANIWHLVIFFVCSLFLLFFEYKYTIMFKTGWKNTFYFSLLIVVPLIFMIFIRIDYYLEDFDSKLLRVISTITYCMHYSFREVVSDISHLFDTHYSERLKFFIVMIVCVIFSVTIYKLSEEKKFKFLRALY